MTIPIVLILIAPAAYLIKKYRWVAVGCLGLGLWIGMVATGGSVSETIDTIGTAISNLADQLMAYLKTV